MSNSPAQRGPDSAEVAAILALHAKRRFEDASKVAHDLIGRFPEHGFGWKVLGAIRHEQGDTEAALTATQRAVEYMPNDAEARLNLSSLLQLAGRLPDALTQCLASFALAPKQGKTYALLGTVQEKLGQRDEAERAFRKALEFDAEDQTALPELAKILMCRGELYEAITHFQNALTIQLRRKTIISHASAKASFDSPENVSLLWQTLAQLASARVHAFATAGTLLGLKREGTLLAFDKDLDIALPFSEMSRASTCLEQHGWKALANTSPMQLINPRDFRHQESGVVVDLCGVGLEESTGKVIGGFWKAGLPWAWQRITEYPAPLSLHQIHRPEGLVWALDHPESWLEALYGDWRTPDPDFDTVIGARNLRGFTLLTQCYALARINNNWQHGNIPKALSLIRHCLRHQPDNALFQQIEQHLQETLA